MLPSADEHGADNDCGEQDGTTHSWYGRTSLATSWGGRVRVLVMGGDGYVGWPVTLRFSALGCDVAVLESFARRQWLDQAGRRSLTPVCGWNQRRDAWEELTGRRITLIEDDLRRPECAPRAIESFRPDVVIQLAGQPSARWAAANVEQAVTTLETNLIASLRVLWAIAAVAPRAHLVKLGTMGEYGRPGVDITDGEMELLHKGRRDRLPFPQRPDSLYDLSKRHDSDNALFAARVWNLRLTVIRQSAVYGVTTSETSADPRLVTRFDYDAAFGAAVNRFCALALTFGEIPIHGDPEAAHSLILLEDTVRCIELVVENPPDPGSPLVINQFGEITPLHDMAQQVARAAGALGVPTKVVTQGGSHPSRPPYRALSEWLPSRGFRPTPLLLGARSTLQALLPHRGRVLTEAFSAALPEPALTGAST
jgi:UDP-sulfoquinovose synthase